MNGSIYAPPTSNLQPPALQLNNKIYTLTPSPRPHRGRSLSPHLYSRSLSPVRPNSTPHFNGRVESRQPMIDPVTGQPNMSKAGRLYRVLFPYKPQQQDELELITGDIITVTMQCSDGWFIGHSTTSGNYGTFPGNYGTFVEVLK